MMIELNDKDKNILLQLARKTLEALHDSSNSFEPYQWLRQGSDAPSGAIEELYPCFVTLYTQMTQLRGCIGALKTTTVLWRNVIEFTKKAALEDPRFEPVEASETKSLFIHISVLSATKPLSHLDDMVLGKHGLVVSERSRRGVLLADVATRYKWSKEEFLQQTCLKAGLSPERIKSYQVEYFEQISFGEN